MTKEEAIILARKAGIEGFLVDTEYHPEGGQSLPNSHSLPMELKNVPYWKLTFSGGTAIVFENERIFLKMQSFFSLVPNF